MNNNDGSTFEHLLMLCMAWSDYRKKYYQLWEKKDHAFIAWKVTPTWVKFVQVYT